MFQNRPCSCRQCVSVEGRCNSPMKLVSTCCCICPISSAFGCVLLRRSVQGHPSGSPLYGQEFFFKGVRAGINLRQDCQEPLQAEDGARVFRVHGVELAP